MKYDKDNVIIVGDTHAPCMLPGYLDFIRDVKRQFRCGKNIHIGDVVDWHAISYHEPDPDNYSASDEFKEAYKQVQQMVKLMPECITMVGNHCGLPYRKARTYGLPSIVMKDYANLWNTPKWEWQPPKTTYMYNGIGYRHGDMGKQGKGAALKNAIDNFIPIVSGHLHSQMSVEYFANERELVFGMLTGWGVDYKRMAMDYAKTFNGKPVIGCGVIYEGDPMVIKFDFDKYT